MELTPGLQVCVMGLAKSGEAVARLLLDHGVRVMVNDRGRRTDNSTIADALEAQGATMVFDGHPLELLDVGFDFIVKNPGIPYTVPFLREALARGIPVYTEIEVASWLIRSPIYAITGSNGKTTTTTLVGEMLTAAGQNPVVAGNIGRVLSGEVAHLQTTQPVVLEVSSFQLMGTDQFHPSIAALLNLTPAHLDYHGSFDDYRTAKRNLFRNMVSVDVAVLNFDQDVVREVASELPCPVVWFSRCESVTDGACVRDGMIVVRRDGEETEIMPVRDVALKGEHNLANALAATVVAVWAGAPVAAVRSVLSSFRGVEHRSEYVSTVNGTEYYNDSKATNPQAALQALRAFPQGIIWIAGGLDRGDDFSLLTSEIAGRVKAAVLLGQSADRLEQVCREAGVESIQRAASIEEAVEVAHTCAEAGDTVLLSPACASWDMYKSFEERGRIFKHKVHTL